MSIRHPPVGVAEQAHQRRHEQGADERRVEDDAGCEADCEGLELVAGTGREDEEGEHEDEGAAGDELSCAGEPELDRLLGGAGLVVGLAHAADHEDLVVHREAVEEGEDHQRDPGDHGSARRDVPELGAVPLLEDEHDDAEGRRERDEVEHDGLEREHDRAKRACEQDQRQDQDQSEHVGEAAEERMDEVAVDCRHPGERAVRALQPVVCAVDDRLDAGR